MSIRIALVGNPNSGKTTMFNALTGSNQYVGNWPGVTVEKKEGKIKGHKEVTLVDLPGIYSLSPYTLEEVVSRDYLLNEKPDAIINIVDASNLERNLYLTTQITELGIPVTVVLNMMDLVNKYGDKIDTKKLSKSLECPVVEASAVKNTGMAQVIEEALNAAQNKKATKPQHIFNSNVEEALNGIASKLANIDDAQKRWYSIKLFERDNKVLEKHPMTSEIKALIKKAEDNMDDDSESIITNERYTYITSILKDSYIKKNKGRITISDKIDKTVTNRFLALPIFAVIMIAVYYVSVSSLGSVLTDWANDGLFGGGWSLFGLEIPGIPGIVKNGLEAINCAEWLSSLIVDGIVGGVGAVLGFLPQMLMLFIFLAILEECGYMARVAFIMDRLFRKFGLSGKSFIPMLIGSGCSVPGIMVSRTIENDRDRRMTIITTSFIPCGAKLPIIALIAGVLFKGAWWVAPAAYFTGIAAVIMSGILLKKTKMFTGDPAPFVMELPKYHVPTFISIMKSMWERGWSFIKKAGTVILLSSIVIWFLAGFGFAEGKLTMVGENMDLSLLASIGNVIAPIFAPLGFGSWQAAVATLMGLVAKEEVVGVFGVLFGVSGDALELVEEGSFGELNAIAAAFTTLSAYSFLIFNLLCAPCFAAIGAMKKEMASAKWTWFAIGYQTILAYAVSLAVFQIGSLFADGGFGIGTAVALLLLAGVAYLIFKPAYKTKNDRLTDDNETVEV